MNSKASEREDFYLAVRRFEGSSPFASTVMSRDIGDDVSRHRGRLSRDITDIRQSTLGGRATPPPGGGAPRSLERAADDVNGGRVPAGAAPSAARQYLQARHPNTRLVSSLRSCAVRGTSGERDGSGWLVAVSAGTGNRRSRSRRCCSSRAATDPRRPAGSSPRSLAEPRQAVVGGVVLSRTTRSVASSTRRLSPPFSTLSSRMRTASAAISVSG